MNQFFSSARHILAVASLGLSLAAPAIAADTAPKMTPSWPRATQERQTLNFNQGWRFMLPPASAPDYLLPAADRVDEGNFSAGTAAQGREI